MAGQSDVPVPWVRMRLQPLGHLTSICDLGVKKKLLRSKYFDHQKSGLPNVVADVSSFATREYKVWHMISIAISNPGLLLQKTLPLRRQKFLVSNTLIRPMYPCMPYQSLICSCHLFPTIKGLLFLRFELFTKSDDDYVQE